MTPVFLRFSLRNHPDFWREAQVRHFPWWSVRFLGSAEPATLAAAVVASKQVSKSAVVRNRAKRQLKEVLRYTWQTTEQPVSLQVVVTLKNPIVKLSHPELQAAWQQTWQKIFHEHTKTATRA